MPSKSRGLPIWIRPPACTAEVSSNSILEKKLPPLSVKTSRSAWPRFISTNLSGRQALWSFRNGYGAKGTRAASEEGMPWLRFCGALGQRRFLAGAAGMRLGRSPAGPEPPWSFGTHLLRPGEQSHLHDRVGRIPARRAALRFAEARLATSAPLRARCQGEFRPHSETGLAQAEVAGNT